MSQELYELIGKHFDEVLADPLIRQLGGARPRKRIRTSEGRSYLSLPSAGISFDAELDRKVTSVFLYAECQEGFRAFRGPLPGGIVVSDSRAQVREKLGRPTESGGGEMIPILGKQPFWDAFDYPGYRLCVNYADGDGSISLVTLMALDAVPK
jgi:hypothetical protein